MFPFSLFDSKFIILFYFLENIIICTKLDQKKEINKAKANVKGEKGKIIRVKGKLMNLKGVYEVKALNK